MSGLLSDIQAFGARPGVLVTIVDSNGSTPRGIGASMIVDRKGRLASGTIGGGALEHRAISHAAELLAGEYAFEQRSFPLGPELGQCCGGQVRLLFERLPLSTPIIDDVLVFVTDLEPTVRRQLLTRPTAEKLLGRIDFTNRHSAIIAELHGNKCLIQLARAEKQPLAIFGAGHVGQAVVRAAIPLPFDLTWIDDRPDQFPADCDSSVEMIVSPTPESTIGSVRGGAFVLVMSHSHSLDYRICRHALARPELTFVGLIGSQTKLVRFRKWARAYDLDESTINRLVCPIGLPAIHGKDPAIIAASVVADLLIRLERKNAQIAELNELRAAS